MTITAETRLATKFGEFDLSHHEIGGRAYISLARGDITRGQPFVRLQSACLFGEAFHSIECDCAKQLAAALHVMEREDCGILVYAQHQEGMGAGLKDKILAMNIERAMKIDPPSAFREMGYLGDLREYTEACVVLQELHCSQSVKSFGNEFKLGALVKAGFNIERMDLAAMLGCVVPDIYRGKQLQLYERDRPLLYLGLACSVMIGLVVGHMAHVPQDTKIQSTYLGCHHPRCG